MQGYAIRAVFIIYIKHIILFLFHLRQHTHTHTQNSAQPPTDFGLGHHGDPLQVQLMNRLNCIGLVCRFCAARWLCSDDSLLWGQRLVCSGCAECSVIISVFDERHEETGLLFPGRQDLHGFSKDTSALCFRDLAEDPEEEA